MSKKDYIFFARVIKSIYEQCETTDNWIIELLICQFCQYFQTDNDLFDKRQFIEACKLDESLTKTVIEYILSVD